MIQIKQATKPEDFQTIEQLAREIFPGVYTPPMPLSHVLFFIDSFQTEKAIAEQIADKNYHYYLLCLDEQVTGYLGIQIQQPNVHLSKLYILKKFRGHKIGKAALEFVDVQAQARQCTSIDLYVNKLNEDTINIYQKAGYAIHQLVAHTYDNGHVEEDYHMVKTLS
ncbi:hypothetical protein BKI52_40355 [marine bacterium AO1-C]|nr:hypothetical protein BKI52_40355 [marine bacterium AO1-C]